MRSKIDFTLVLCVIFLVGMITGIITSASYVPRLKAFGCDGAKGVIFANNEDDLPSCQQVRGNR